MKRPVRTRRPRLPRLPSAPLDALAQSAEWLAYSDESEVRS